MLSLPNSSVAQGEKSISKSLYLFSATVGVLGVFDVLDALLQPARAKVSIKVKIKIENFFINKPPFFFIYLAYHIAKAK